MTPRDLFGLVGKVIADKLRVERVLGEGGYGVVYAGTHLVLGMPVAIKCLKPVGHTPEEKLGGIEAFLRESRILFGLSHPAIVRLYDAGVVPDLGVPYAVLELLGGTTLADDIAARAPTRRHYGREELVSIFGAILDGVAFAHDRGIVHRDLKPTNLMLVADGSRLQPKVLDFGTARASVDMMQASGASTTGGFTPLYAAPEQWDRARGAIGPRSDVHALGLTLAEMCLLRYPYDARIGIGAVLRDVLDEGTRPRIGDERPDLPSELENVVHRALRVRPDERYADAREMLVAFRAALKASPATAPLARPLAMAPPPSAPAPSAPPAPMPPTTALPLTVHSAPLPPPRSSALPWVLAATFLAVAVLAIGGGVVAAVRLASTKPAVADPPDALAVPSDEPSAADEVPPIVQDAAVDASSRGGTRVVATTATGGSPFWTTSELLDVAKKNERQLATCADEARASDPSLRGTVTVTVSPDEHGVVGSVMCSAEADQSGDEVLCACIERTIGRWRYPRPHGRLGLLTSGPFIYTLRIVPLP